MKPTHKNILVVITLTLLAAALVPGITGFVEPQQKQTQKQDPEKGLDDIRAKLKEAKRALAREGKYSCCISPSCDFCAISVGKCPCQDNLSAGDPVCHECKGGWHAGHGVIDGVKPEEVKTLPTAMNKMMYDVRAKKYLNKR